MLKITREPGVESATLRLEGRLVGPWVAELRQVAETALNDSRRLVFDVSNVSFVDRKGEELLRELVARQVRLERPSGFIRELLKGGPK